MAERQFRGGVFAAKLTGGRAGATLYVLPEGLRARTEAGEMFEISYPELTLELGGASGRMLFCRNADRTVTLFCEERGFIFALTSVAGNHIKAKLAPVQGALLRHQARRVAWGLAGVAMLVALWVGLPPAVRWGIRSAVQAVPFSVDEKLGAASLATMDLGGARVNDALVTQSLERMLQRLSPHVGLEHIKFTPYVIDAEAVNAFAFPGGPMIVYTGLLRLAQSPEQVAAVLAHEMGHVVHRHGLQRIAQSLGIVATVQFCFGDVGGALALGKELLTVAAINNYSREDENQADTTAVQILHAARLQPMALVDFFKRMQAQQATQGGADVPAWISSHPALTSRIEAIKSQAANFPPLPVEPVQGVDWAAVQAHLPRPAEVP